MRTWLVFSLVALAGGMTCTMPAAAAESHDPATNAAQAAGGCVEVEVNGERAPSFSCLTQKLQPAGSSQRANAAPGLASEAIVQRPSNQLGLFNRAATSNRMGNTFGTSVYPQRPPAYAPTSPMFPRPRP